MCYTVTRTIQPVGQGGFYTEIFEIPNQKGEISTRCVVYDCGSATRSEPKKTIESALFDEDGLDIDILFISHFDDDHVNGLTELSKKHRIKRIVIPQIHGYEWFYVLEDSIKRGTYQPRGNLINSFLKSIRNETSQNEIQIIEIAPIDSEERPGRNNYDAQSINELNYRKFWYSGLGFYPFEKEIGWIYIPVNTMDLNKINSLKRELAPIFGAEYDTAIWDELSGEQCAKVISENRSKINAVYKKVFGSSNASSMCLYSGLDSVNHQSESIIHSESIYKDCWQFCYRRHYWCGRKDNSEACLYTGDSNLNDPNLRKTLSSLLNPFIRRIGLIQIPHHGSVHNSSNNAFNELCEDALPSLFVSYGCYNRYGHPSTRLFGKLRADGYAISEVTEKKDSYHMEIVKIL